MASTASFLEMGPWNSSPSSSSWAVEEEAGRNKDTRFPKASDPYHASFTRGPESEVGGVLSPSLLQLTTREDCIGPCCTFLLPSASILSSHCCRRRTQFNKWEWEKPRETAIGLWVGAEIVRPPTGLDFCTRDEEEKSLLMLTDPPAVTAATHPIAAAGAIGYGGCGYGKKEELKEEKDKVVELEKRIRYGLDMASLQQQQQQRTRGREMAHNEKGSSCARTSELSCPPTNFFQLGQTYSAFLQGEPKRLLCTKERELS